MNQRYVVYALSGVLVVLVVSLGYGAFERGQLEKTIAARDETIDSLHGEMEPYEALYNLVKDKPDTSFVTGLSVVSGSSISYSHDLTEDLPDKYTYHHYSIFYSPVEDATLHIVSGKLLPRGDFPFPLTLQRGNAVLNESALRVDYPGETNTTYVQWQSPIVWERNVTGSESMDIELDDAGWYTLSMNGPIRRTSSGATNYRFFLAGTGEVVQVADIWVDYRLYYESEVILFGLWPG